MDYYMIHKNKFGNIHPVIKTMGVAFNIKKSVSPTENQRQESPTGFQQRDKTSDDGAESECLIELL
jgi:hypothetical protein